MTTYVQDSFNRANNTLTPGTPDVGGPYTVAAGFQAGITSNQLYFNGVSTTGGGSHLTFPGAADIDLTCTLATAHTAAAGLIARYNTPGNHWQFGASLGGGYTIARVRSSVRQDLAFSQTLCANGDVLRFIALGSMFYGFVNGKLACQLVDDGSVLAGTAGGVMMRSTGSRIDNLQADDASALSIVSGWVYKNQGTKALDTIGAT